MQLVWGAIGQLRFRNAKEYYTSLGIFANPELTSIRWEENTKTGSYADAYRLRVHSATQKAKLPNAIKNALKDGGRINCNPYVLNLLDNHGFVMSGNRIVASYEDVINTIPNDDPDDLRAFIEGYNLLRKDSGNKKRVTYQTESIDVSSAVLKINSAPKGKKKVTKRKHPIGKRDYIQKALDDFETGEAGERIVYNHERQKLKTAKANGLITDLKNKLEWVSQEDDSAGYDIKSYDPKTKREMYIEVKTTTAGALEPFFMTANEVEKSQKYGEDYYIYRVYKMNKKSARIVDCYVLNGDVSQNKHLKFSSNGYVVEITIGDEE